jgi:hypothetical protein
MAVGTSITNWLLSLQLDIALPDGFEVLTPYAQPEVRSIVKAFGDSYQSDDRPRLGLWGINPGRFGAGVTGLAFTDPWAVVHQLGIPTEILGRRELSAEFVSRVIEAYGGAAPFYQDVVLTAFCPLGFVRDGVNVNFYDDAALVRAIIPFVHQHINAMHASGVRRDAMIVLGTGALKRFVERHVCDAFPGTGFTYLEHPRYIMQYKRKHLHEYVQRYVEQIRALQG